MSGPAEPVSSLTPITSFSHFRDPLAGGEAADPNPPPLIMIFGWLNARLTHVLHYSRMHAKIYPTAPQVIIECDITAVAIGTYSGNITRMHPVVKQLDKLGLFTDHPRRILIHTLSNGGIIQLHWLKLAINQFHDSTQELTTRRPIRPTLLILDSSPSVGDYTEFVKSFRRAKLVYLANRVLAGIHLRPQLRKFILDFTEGSDHSNPNKDTVFSAYAPLHPPALSVF
ncbi:hypothetical protein C8F01DRAFT_1256578 [Mycena amicta]|nr:hypothetical protein C8F01DRAFT_1256578 [Mycena amicta]